MIVILLSLFQENQNSLVFVWGDKDQLWIFQHSVKNILNRNVCRFQLNK